MLRRLDVPAALQRNSRTVSADGYVETGAELIRLATARLGLDTLGGTDVLDIGCGVRFTQTICNRAIPIGSYTGIEVYRPIVDFMHRFVVPFDSRFTFVHWDVHHTLYNPASSRPMAGARALPVDRTFDAIWMFSVVTHLDRVDAGALLRLCRGAIRPGGTLIFTAFVDDDLDGWAGDSKSKRPLRRATFGRAALEHLIVESGWQLRAFHAGGPRPFLQPCFVYSPDANVR